MITELKARSKRYINKLNRWKDIIADWQRSSMKQREYCCSKQIAYSTFKNWRGKVKREKLRDSLLVTDGYKSSNEFIPIKITEESPSRLPRPIIISSELTIKTKEGHEIKVCSDFDEKTMVKLLKAFRLAEGV